MGREFDIMPSPVRPDYLRNQRLNPYSYLSYTKKFYVTTFKSAAWPSADAAVNNALLLEDGFKLLLEDGSALLLEESSAQSYSLIYLFRDSTPLLYGGVASGKSSGTDQLDLSLVFPSGFFRTGHIMTYEVCGKLTQNTINTSLSFTITFPDSGTPATISMPTTVDANSLSDWNLVVTSIFNFNTSSQGLVSHTGKLTVKNTTVTSGESTTLMATVQNTFDYDSVLYYKPQVNWTAVTANSTTEFYSASLMVV